LEVSKWVQGDAVTEFKPGTVYIVEFWATWCGPCKASIPHLNQIYGKFKDKGLVVIGQDVWEDNSAVVEPFVKKMGTNMTYCVTLDSIPEGEKAMNGKMARNWMAAAEQDGIPTAFLINQTGKIAWIGHPSHLTEEMLSQVYAGTFDAQKLADQNKESQARQKEYNQRARALFKAMDEKQWDKAWTAADELEKLLPDDQKGTSLIPVRVVILFGMGKGADAGSMAEKFVRESTNYAALNSMAWELCRDKAIQPPALAVAFKAAEKANKLSESKIPALMDTLARIYFQQGDKDKAIELEGRAIQLADPGIQEELKKILASYKEGRLPDVK
jgi:thiol-disulfide isomerase/thioredoxin